MPSLVATQRNNMNIYFGEIPKEYVEQGLEGFEYKDKLYDYCLTVSEDHVVVSDAIDRYVPFSHNDLIHLFHAIKEALPYSMLIADGENAMERLATKADSCV